MPHPRGISTLWVGRGLLESPPIEVLHWVRGRNLFVVSSPRVWALHESRLKPIREAAGAFELLEIPEGEAAKTLDQAGQLWNSLLSRGGKRDSRIISLGGGSVGDLAGFVAACFLRGVEYSQVPTTLLAQVDAAIGGKTAVDLPGGKNTVGAFHHPTHVLSDPVVLSTLPRRELWAGLVEVIKKAFILDADFYEVIERILPELLLGNEEALLSIILGAQKAKAEVVARDPEESGDRKLLNFGHTLGHAIETELGYQHLLHGEAVGWGMLFALQLAERSAPVPGATRLRALLRKLEWPDLPPLEVEALVEHTAKDKKAREEGVSWVLPRAIGRGDYGPLPWGPDFLKDWIQCFLEAPWASVSIPSAGRKG